MTVSPAQLSGCQTALDTYGRVNTLVDLPRLRTRKTMQKIQDSQRMPLPHSSFKPSHQVEIQRLHRLTVYGRWLVVLALWLTVGALSLWQLRFRIQLLMDYFTWVAVRYGLAYHQGAALGLALCLGATAAVMTWHSRNLMFGLPKHEQLRLQQQLLRIQQQGPTHPLWRWVCGEQKRL
ncbi:hypothetical protein [Altericista sp. CCNU0014]|uniref:hypothetical protein n=1 Tax=Altericista sp. CCNU0014 TaxID=3082949 RepID=UPI00384C03B1